MSDLVVVTGGVQAWARVRVYGEQGWVEDWPSILTSRYDHGCGHYVNADSEVVSR